MHRGERIGAYLLVALWVLDDFAPLLEILAVGLVLTVIAILFGGGLVDVDFP